MLRWRMFIEEFNTIIRFIPGELNSCADYFSRIRTETILEEKSPAGVEVGPSLKPEEESFHQDIVNDDCQLAEQLLNLECYINIPDGQVYPMSYEYIKQAQMHDMRLQSVVKAKPHEYIEKMVTNDISLFF